MVANVVRETPNKILKRRQDSLFNHKNEPIRTVLIFNRFKELFTHFSCLTNVQQLDLSSFHMRFVSLIDDTVILFITFKTRVGLVLTYITNLLWEKAVFSVEGPCLSLIISSIMTNTANVKHLQEKEKHRSTRWERNL